MKRPAHRLSTERAQRFCRAVAAETGARRNWWVSIQSVADRLGLEVDEATVLADDCAQAGLVSHDQSQHTAADRRMTTLPHSVSMAADGWDLVRRQQG